MLLLNIALLALSALPTTIAKYPGHHLSHSTLSTSTFASQTTFSNATIPLTTAVPATTSASSLPVGGSGCPTVTETVTKTLGPCPEIKCRPVLVGGTTPVITSTFVVGCGCPAATPTATLSQCNTGCERLTSWVYETAGGGC